MSNFITAYSKRTGKKVRVPAHFFDVPSLSRDLSKTPRQNKADERKPRPSRRLLNLWHPVTPHPRRHLPPRLPGIKTRSDPECPEVSQTARPSSPS